jgi:hypothetical protein
MQTWLEGLNIPQNHAQSYAPRFLNHGIDDENELRNMHLSYQDFGELKVKIGHRQKIIDAIALLLPPPAPPVTALLQIYHYPTISF